VRAAAADDNNEVQYTSSLSLQANNPTMLSTFQWDDFDEFSRANFQALPQPFTWDDFYKEFPDIIDDDNVRPPHTQSTTTMMNTQILTTSSTPLPELEVAAGPWAQPTQPKLPPNYNNNTHAPPPTQQMMTSPCNISPSVSPLQFDEMAPSPLDQFTRTDDQID